MAHVERWIIASVIMVSVLAAIIGCVAGIRAGTGFFVGAAWMGLNVMLMMLIFQIAANKRPQDRLKALILIKFPVMYIGAFFILYYRLIPAWSFLSGLTTCLIIAGARGICLKKA